MKASLQVPIFKRKLLFRRLFQLDTNYFAKGVETFLKEAYTRIAKSWQSKNILYLPHKSHIPKKEVTTIYYNIMSNVSEEVIIKRDFFIKSRQEDIRKYYEFNPKILGRGAYGVVYRARLIEAPHTNRVVKLIAKKMVKNPDSLQNQIDIMKRLDHPMVVRLYQTFEDDKNLLLVQDFCEGGELFERLEQHGNFSEEDAREMFLQIIKSIKYLHSEKICHRDLKPENFLMSSKLALELKLIDFGLSYQWKKSMREELKQDKRNKLIGTSYYIAPEVLKLDYDQRCDIWSAGVILYILVTAAPPFDGENDRQIMQNVKKLEWSFDIPEAKNLSEQIKDLIAKILVPAENRITIENILAHPWMSKQLNSSPLKLDFTRLKNFSKFSKFKALAVSYIATQLPEKQIRQLGKLFAQIDTNSDGYLTVEQLQLALQKQNENTNYAELKSLIHHIDTDKNGKINYNQFVSACLESSITQNQEYLEYVFRSFDKDKSGKISRAEIRQIFEASGVQAVSGKALEEIIASCDSNNDGEIDLKEFLSSMGLKK